jgi:hypothetical protein
LITPLQVLQLFHVVIQSLDSLKLPVDEVNEQPVQQIADTELAQVRAFISACDDRTDVKPVILANGDQRLACDENRHFASRKHGGAGVGSHPCGG